MCICTATSERSPAYVLGSFSLFLSSAVTALVARRDRIVVSTLRCGRSNPGSNLGHGIATQCHGIWVSYLFAKG